MRKGSKTWHVFLEVCDGIGAVGGEMMHMMGRPSVAMRYSHEEYMEMRSYFDKREKRQALQRLRQKQLIEIEKVGKKAFIHLTDQGRLEALRTRMLACSDDLPSGQVCLVCFDIPEHVRDVRIALCRLLRKIGFTCVQKSVWVCDRNVVEIMKRYLQESGLDKWARVYLAQEM